ARELEINPELKRQGPSSSPLHLEFFEAAAAPRRIEAPRRPDAGTVAANGFLDGGNRALTGLMGDKPAWVVNGPFDLNLAPDIYNVSRSPFSRGGELAADRLLDPRFNENLG